MQFRGVRALLAIFYKIPGETLHLTLTIRTDVQALKIFLISSRPFLESRKWHHAFQKRHTHYFADQTKPTKLVPLSGLPMWGPLTHKIRWGHLFSCLARHSPAPARGSWQSHHVLLSAWLSQLWNKKYSTGGNVDFTGTVTGCLTSCLEHPRRDVLAFDTLSFGWFYSWYLFPECKDQSTVLSVPLSSREPPYFIFSTLL